MSQTGAKTGNSDADGPLDAIEGRLRVIIDTIPTIVWRKLPDGSADFLNQHFREYTGLSLEDGLGWGWMNAFHPDDRLIGEWRAALAVGKPFEKEARLRRADGEYRWFLIRAVPLQDEQGNTIKWYGLTCDIQDRKQAEDRLHLVLDTTPALIHTGRPDGYLDYFNQRWLKYVGLSLKDLRGWAWTAVIHPEDVEGVVEKWRAALTSGEPFEAEARVRRADGVYRWMLHRKVALRDEHGNIVKWYGTGIDIEDRKRAERQSRALIDAIPQQIWSGPPDGTLDYCNERWRSYMGLGLEELQGDGWQSMLHPDDRDRVIKAWHDSVTSGTPYEQEERHRGADGTYRWFLARGVPLRNAEGRIVRWYGTNTDIEDRKRAEEALRSSEREQRHIAAQLERERARLVEAQEVAKIGSWEAELPSLNVIWSKQTHRIFETDPSRFHPTRPKFREFIHPEDRAKVDAAFVASLEKRSPCTVEYRIVMPDGRIKFIEESWRAFHDEEGKPVRVAGTCLDITERVRADQELRQAEERIRAILEYSPNWIYLKDTEGRYLLVNREIERVFGISQEQIKGKTDSEIFPPEQAAKYRANDLKVLRAGLTMEFEEIALLKDGPHTSIVHKFPLFDTHGNIYATGGVATDITERVRAEEELQRLSGKLLRFQDEERRRIARELHDSTGQNLVALATMLGQLSSSMSSAGRKSRQLLSECKALADQCIREIRTLSYVLHPPVLDQAGLADAIRDYVDGFTKRSGIQVELELSPHLGRMARDMELALFRVVQESLTNIQRHSGSQQAKIRIDRNSDLTLEISDLGRGVSAGAQRGKEEPRFEVGVGIPSMQERVKLIGGRLEIDSTSDGTTVRVTIPLERNEREKAAHSGG